MADLDRREFLRAAATLGLSVAALAVFEQACSISDSTATTVSGTNMMIGSNDPLMIESTGESYPTIQTSSITYNSAAKQESDTLVNPGSESSQDAIDLAKDSIEDPVIRMKHLARRIGFGANEKELNELLEIGEEAAIERFLNYEVIDDSDLETRLSELGLGSSMSFDKTKANYKHALQQEALLRMIYSKRPLQEKMVLFWHGIITSSFGKVPSNKRYMADQDQLFRENALSQYDDFLKKVARDPAMLIYLDNRLNKKGKPNENFARELMELFSMGVGTFTELDVKEASRAFTGWGIKDQKFKIFQNQHDSAVKTFMGRVGEHDGDDIIDIIMDQPATSQFITKRLFEFFVYDDPSSEIIEKLSATFERTRYSVKAVISEIFASDEFYSQRAYRSKIKSPAELIAGTFRVLEIDTDANWVMQRYCTPMGQNLFQPFDVSGFPEGHEWINSSTLISRLNFANAFATGSKSLHLNTFEPQKIVPSNLANSTHGTVGYLVSVLLDDVISDEEKNIYVNYFDALTETTRKIGNKQWNGKNKQWNLEQERLRSLIYLVMSSPDYQLA